MPYLSKSANSILYTPFDNKSIADKKISEKLTCEEFLKECFVYQRFKKKLEFDNDSDYMESYDYVIKSDNLKDLLENQSDEYENFIKWTDSVNNSKVYTISGNAGTGKTTFIYKLQSLNKDKKWIILDVSQAKDFIDWFNGIKSNINNFELPYNKLYAIILEYIRKILFNDDSNIDDIRKNLMFICKNYKKNYKSKNLRGSDFLKGIIKKNNIITNLRKREYVIYVAEYIRDYFKELENNKSDLKDKFRSALDILLILSCCKYETKRNIYIVVFDNIERFILNDEIYNKDLDMIRKDLFSYSKDINDNSKRFQNIFKFILSMRNNSARMCGVKLQSADELPSDINLTNWFLIDDIINSKFNWYKKNNIKMLDVGIVCQILCDIRTCNKSELTGLQLFINSLFNDNLRLITDFIGMLIEKKSNKIYVEKYIELWKENTSVSRFAARSIIRGLIYQELSEHDNLFHHLKLYTQVERKIKDKNDNDYGLSYVRKILTILYNKNDDVTLGEIIGTLCSIDTNVQKYWNETLPDKTKMNIAEILYYMNSYNRRDNDWIQFIDMQIVGMDNTTIISDEKSLKNLIDNKLESISLRIMPAGESYLRYMVASFEYFSFRFYKNHENKYRPIFTVIPSLKELGEISNLKKAEQLPCYKIMNYVKDNAINCIKNINKTGDIELYINNNHLGKRHAQRIVEQHQGFIDNFINYLRGKYKNNPEINDGLNILINACWKIKEQYNDYKTN